MVEILQNVRDIESISTQWNLLSKPFKTPLLRYEWFATCAEAFCKPGQLRIVVISYGAELVAIAPMVLNKKTLELLATSFLFEPSGFIYKDYDSLIELLDVIIAIRKPVFLKRLYSESQEIYMLRKINRGSALILTSNAPPSPWFPIIGSWTDFENSLSSRRRSDLRRAQKRAEDLGHVEFQIFSPASEKLEDYLDEIFRVEAAGWKGRNGSAIVTNKPLKHFFCLYSRVALSLGILRLCILWINEHAAAVQLSIEYAKRFWVLKVGYDEKYARCSPGILLMHETIRYAFEQGLEAYEFLGEEESWIKMWPHEVHTHGSCRIYPLSFQAQLRLGVDASMFIAHKVRSLIGRS